MKILTIVGARPQFIKAAVINRAIKKYNENNSNKLNEIIVHTGQHFDQNMSGVFFEELGMDNPKYNLNIGAETKNKLTPATQISAMLLGLEKVINTEKPDIVLLYGDTNSTLAGAIMASKIRVPIAHVEAGVRNYDMHNVEEQNRIITDHMSSFLFCPTDSAVKCLEREGITDGLRKNNTAIYVQNVGDVMYDAFIFEHEKCQNYVHLFKQYQIEKDSYILLTIHRDENVNPDKLSRIFLQLAKINEKIIFPIHPRTRKLIDNTKISMSNNITCIDPLGYREMLFMQKNARLIITDSGGVQKEAYFSKTPCITVMEKTGWTETVDTGWNILVDSDCNFIKLLDLKREESKYNRNLFGSGQAGENIVSVLARG